MKTKCTYKWWLVSMMCLCLLNACTSQEIPEDTSVEENAPEGGFMIYATDYTVDWREGENSRAQFELSDELQKQIHNLYYFFYDRAGFLENIYYQCVDPTLQVKVNFSDFKDVDGSTVTPSGTVYIIANVEQVTSSGKYPKPVLVSADGVALRPDIDVFQWRQNVPTVKDFEQKALFPVFMDAEQQGGGQQGGVWSIGRPDHIQLFGYFNGTLDEGKAGEYLQIPLGRMVARMKIVLTGNGLGIDDGGSQARVTIENAARYSALFPNRAPMPTDDVVGNIHYWGDYVEVIDTGRADDNKFVWEDCKDLTHMHGDTNEHQRIVGIDFGDGYSGGITKENGVPTATLFFYCGENNVYYTDKRTFLKVEVWDGTPQMLHDENETILPDFIFNRTNPDRTYRIALGHDSPEINNNNDDDTRDYSLYRNTAYTFNIVLNK